MARIKTVSNGYFYNGWDQKKAVRARARELYVRMRARFDAGIETEVNYDELEEYAKKRKRLNHGNYRGPRTVTLSKKV